MNTTDHLPAHPASAGCTCCQPMTPMTPMTMARRRFLKFWTAVAGGTLVSGWLTPVAADSRYDAMLVNCIDPRLTTEHFNAMATLSNQDRRTLPDNYSHFVIAGGALGSVHPAFRKWHDTFWENLAISVKLHQIRRVVGLTHRDCGAAKLALGEQAVADRQTETRSHGEWLQVFAQGVRERHPQLQVVTGIIDFDGSIEKIPV